MRIIFLFIVFFMGMLTTTTAQDVVGRLQLPDDGTAYAEFADNTHINPTNALTVEAWVQATKLKDNIFEGTIIGKSGGGTGERGYDLRIGKTGIDFNLGTPDGWKSVTYNTTVPTHTDMHIAGVFDGTTLKIYVDGVEKVSTDYTGTINASSTNLLIGENPTWSGRHFYGTIDEVRIWNVARTAAQISANKDRFVCPNNTNNTLVAYFPIKYANSNDTNKTLRDYTGNGNLLTLKNSATVAATGLVWDDTVCDTASFNTKWETTTANESITIPTASGATYNYTVDWGDGNTTYGETGSATHTYATAGTYTVKITGTFPRFKFDSTDQTNRDKIKEVSQWGGNPWTNMAYAFYNCSNLTLTATDTPNLANVTDMSSMFYKAAALNSDISSWDTSNVTNMAYMFNGATSFNQNISSWDVSNVTYMSGMFNGATSFNQNISSWDVSNVTYMPSMFNGATSFNQNISSWDTSNVLNMSAMFYLATSFDQNLGNWNISKVTDMDYMFGGVTLSTANYDAILDKWSKQSVQPNVPFSGGSSKYCDVGEAGKNILTNATNSWTITDGGKDTDANCDALKFITVWETTTANESITIPTASGATYNYTVDWGDGNTSTAQTGRATHTYATAGTYTVKITGTFPQIQFSSSNQIRGKLKEVSNWGTNPWTSMSGAFYNCVNLTLTATDAPNLTNVTDMSSMFYGARSFNQDISSWDVSKVTNMHAMFDGATAFNQDISNWNISNVLNMSAMFGGATAFNQDISNWNISNVLNMSAMFYQATSFNQNISSWNTSNVTNMYGMFYQATSFDQNLGNWNISKVTDMEYMFTDVTLSTANYDAMLDKWSKQSVQPNVTFSGGNSKYCDVGEAGRNILTNATNNWTITDGGKNCSTLSVSKNTVSAWTLYPNPTQDRIEISGNTPVLNVQLFSITGKKMLTKDNTNSLSLKAVPKGMYLMKIRGENGTYTHKVIKQ